MDISGVMTSVTGQAAARQKSAETVAVAQQNKAVESDAETSAELEDKVVHQAQEVPAEKLPPHLGRNVNVKA